MAVEAKLKHEYGKTRHTLSAAAQGGDIVQLPDGRAAVILGTGDYASGDVVEVAYTGEFECLTASGTTFSAGAVVEWDDTNKLVVANTAGDFDLGRAVVAKTSGQTVTLVRLNDSLTA